MTNVVSAMVLLLSLLTACGSDESAVLVNSAEKDKPKELKSENLPEVEETYRLVVVVPWETTTHERYLKFKTHAYYEKDKTLVVSTSDPGENWFSVAPKTIQFTKQKFVLDTEKSTAIIDVYAKTQTVTTRKSSGSGRRTVVSYTYPHRLEIRLYKDVNGSYTGECDYNIQFQTRGTWGDIKEYTDRAINQSCPLHRMIEYVE